MFLRVKLAQKLLNWRNKTPMILTHPDRRLKRIAQEVDFNKMPRSERVRIVRKMASALGGTNYGQKLGLAAPQIGIPYRVIIVRGNVMFNPTWTPSKQPPNIITESCYSVPNRFFKVQRATGGWARWTNIDGNPCEDKINGLPAIVFQHEMDHLNGICCVDIGEEVEMQPSRTAEEENNNKNNMNPDTTENQNGADVANEEVTPVAPAGPEAGLGTPAEEVLPEAAPSEDATPAEEAQVA